MDKYIVVLFNGKREHIYKSLIAENLPDACNQAYKLYKAKNSINGNETMEAFKMAGGK